MLEFKPEHIKDNIYSFSAFENGEDKGKCTFSIDGMNMTVLSLCADMDDVLIEEGLLRSSLNFGVNRNVYMAYADSSAVNEAVFLSLGFENNGGILSSDIPSALKGSCSGCK